MKTLIIGMGEVGSALFNILVENYPTQTFDNRHEGWGIEKEFEPEIMHICFPYSESFISDVKAYQERYKPKYTVIHSTVPFGCSRQVGAIHSPIRGLHPFLEAGIKGFVKFLGGEQASEVADYFRRAGLRVTLFDKAETTEALKLFDTEYYRACIEFAKRVKAYCDKNGLNFHEVYTLGNVTYNEGYTLLNHPEYVRPVLQPIMTEIGGHCVLPNKELIKLSE